MNKTIKILVDENIPFLAEILSTCGSVEKFTGRLLTNSDIIKSRANALITRSTTKVNKSLLQNTKIKFVGTATSGTDHIDVDYLKESNIAFASADGSNANSVAEYVVYSMLKWAKQTQQSLLKKIIGIIGYGNIGRIVAKYAHNLEMQVLVNDPPLRDSGFKFPDFIEYVSIDEIFSNSEIITDHVPLTKGGDYPTFQLINSRRISLIPESSLLIHTSRGGVVDETALLERLQDNSLYAAIDVWESEPLINTELASETILSTPHIAGYSYDGKLRGTKMMAKAIENFSGLKVNLEILNKELSQYQPISSENFKDEQGIYKLLSESRKLYEDHAALTASLPLPDKERASVFDSMRKNYPRRREML